MEATKVFNNQTSVEVTQSKIVAPKLRFKGFDVGWKFKKMEELGSFMGGGTPTTSIEKYWIGDIPWISSSDLFEDDLHNINIHRFLNKEAISASATKVIPKNSVLLISRVGVGKLAVNKTELCTSQDFSNFIPNGCDSYFIGYFLLARKNLLTNFAQGTSIKGFTTSDVKSLKVSIPTLPEQQKIASFLSAVDEKIQQLTRKKELLEQYKKGVMQQLFSRKLRFRDENGKAFPEWEEKKLGEIGEFQTSSVDKQSVAGEKEVYLVNYMNVYRHENINQKTIKGLQVVTAKENQLVSCNLKKGDILFTPSSETPDDIGHSVVIFEDLENCVFSYHLMRFRPKIEIDILYSHYFCNISVVLNQLSKLATGSTRFTISVKSFSSVKINLPSINEQKKIANYLSNIDKKIESVTKQITYNQTFKKGLLQQMFV